MAGKPASYLRTEASGPRPSYWTICAPSALSRSTARSNCSCICFRNSGTCSGKISTADSIGNGHEANNASRFTNTSSVTPVRCAVSRPRIADKPGCPSRSDAGNSQGSSHDSRREDRRSTMNSTKIRVPAITGLPTRIFGSIAILSLSSTSL